MCKFTGMYTWHTFMEKKTTSLLQLSMAVYVLYLCATWDIFFINLFYAPVIPHFLLKSFMFTVLFTCLFNTKVIVYTLTNCPSNPFTFTDKPYRSGK